MHTDGKFICLLHICIFESNKGP